MHIEILVEDSSGEKLLQVLLPQLIGPQGIRIPGDYMHTKASAEFRLVLKTRRSG